MRLILGLFLGLLFFLHNLQAQQGCTDPQAINYDPHATGNDGSCTYSPTEQSLILACALSSDLNENSGFAWYNGQLWAHNDSGDEAAIYQVDTLDGKVLRKVVITQATNVDWEDMAQDETYLYIGDVGNNNGDRRDLRIYKVLWEDILNTNDNSAEAEIINFSYAEQQNFDSRPREHAFDCEAMIHFEGKLHLFSKDWISGQTMYYQLPDQPGSYSLEAIRSFDVEGLITAADIDKDRREISLLGYASNFITSFVWILRDFEASDVFSGNKRKVDLQATGFGFVGQTEGMVYKKPGECFISTEAISDFSFEPTLYSFQTLPYQTLTNVSSFLLKKTNIFPNPSKGFLTIENPQKLKIEIRDAMGKTVFQANKEQGSIWQYELHELAQGLYFIHLSHEQQSATLRWIKQ